MIYIKILLIFFFRYSLLVSYFEQCGNYGHHFSSFHFPKLWILGTSFILLLISVLFNLLKLRLLDLSASSDILLLSANINRQSMILFYFTMTLLSPHLFFDEECVQIFCSFSFKTEFLFPYYWVCRVLDTSSFKKLGFANI